MLRASIEFHGSDGDVRAVTEGEKLGDAGIEHGERLMTFARAAVAGDEAELATARDALRAAAGSEVVVDAAGVIGNFQRMVRIADGTGIPIDGVVRALSEDFREDIGIDDFVTRRAADMGVLARTVGPAARGAVNLFLRVAGRRSRKAPSSD
ncbi:MAG: hypothetical protein GY725_04365 [bacterium]|nr:hypothetical protein [bacterium]